MGTPTKVISRTSTDIDSEYKRGFVTDIAAALADRILSADCPPYASDAF